LIVTIHQPNLFPWMGFFDKMEKADMFIFLDNVQFTKRGFQNRVKVKGFKGPQWLTVPVKTKGKYYQRTDDVGIDNEIDWRNKHIKTLESLYGGTPNFDQYFSEINEIYNKDYKMLVDFTSEGIHWIKDILGIKTRTLNGSLLNLQGESSRLLANIVKAVGGTVYLSGPSGRKYLDENVFKAENIKIEYHEFKEEMYPQKHNDFTGGLSTLDYLFNVGR
jgi:hypothetical protein